LSYEDRQTVELKLKTLTYGLSTGMKGRGPRNEYPIMIRVTLALETNITLDFVRSVMHPHTGEVSV